VIGFRYSLFSYKMSKIPEVDRDEYRCCDETNSILNGEDKNVICIIRRDQLTACNVIVYRANVMEQIDAFGNVKNILHPKDPIDIFWLKISEQDLKKHRESGKYDDRVKLNKLEKKMVYGVKCTKITKKANKKKMRKKLSSNDAIKDSDYDSSFLVTLNALKKQESLDLILRIDPIDNKPYLCGKINVGGHYIECVLNEILVTMKKSKVPKVSFATIRATRCDNKQPIEAYVW